MGDKVCSFLSHVVDAVVVCKCRGVCVRGTISSVDLVSAGV